MEHEHCRDLISLDCDGRLPAADRAALDLHVETCGECGLFLEGVRAASAALKNAEPPRRSEIFVQAVMARLPAEEEAPLLPLRWLVPAFCAAFAAVVAVWSPTLTAAFSGPESIVTASLEGPVLELWGETP